MQAKLNRIGRQIGRNWGLYLLLLPSLVLLIIFAYKPMYGVIIAFKKYKNALGIMGSPWIDPIFKNFERFFSSFQCSTTIRNTIALSLYSMIAGFPIPIMLAWRSISSHTCTTHSAVSDFFLRQQRLFSKRCRTS